MDAPEILSALDQLVAGSSTEELPAVVGRLVEAEERARLRIRAGSANATAKVLTDDRLLKMPEVAERLGITEHLAREMGRRGELPVVHVGERHVRVSTRALEEWMRRSTLPASRAR